MGSHSRMSALKLLTVLIVAGVAEAALPRLDVYYESLCPYSRQFIREEVFPAYLAVSDYFDVFFIAYGNADTTGDIESGFSIECQHGERECVGNVVQACTVKYQPDMWTQVDSQAPGHSQILHHFPGLYDELHGSSRQARRSRSCLL